MKKGVYIDHLKETMTFVEMSKISEHDLSPQLLAKRWRNIGRPATITKWHYDQLMGPRINRTMQKRTKIVQVNGVEYTAAQLANIYQVSRSTIFNVISRHGRFLTSDHFNFNRNRQEAQNKRKPTPDPVYVNKEEKEDRSPGWAERKYFPDTGKNGFSGGKSEIILPARVVF